MNLKPINPPMLPGQFVFCNDCGARCGTKGVGNFPQAWADMDAPFTYYCDHCAGVEDQCARHDRDTEIQHYANAY